MTQVSVHEAQQRLPELLAAVEAGEMVSIRADNGRTFRLAMPPTSEPVVNPDWPGYPHAGSAKGLIEVPDDFDEPLDELKEYSE
jgi:antitoxin (DNA-binding transcriptional repressor) of toxin-antitoxin stability system